MSFERSGARDARARQSRTLRATSGSVVEAKARMRPPFAEPDRFDIGRGAKRSFSFGWGSHFHLGVALVRTEVQEVLRGIACDTRSIERIGAAPRQVPFVSIRRLETFAIRVEAC